MIFQIYKDRIGEYRWRLWAANNKIIADSAEGYTAKAGAEHGIQLVKDYAGSARVVDEDD